MFRYTRFLFIFLFLTISGCVADKQLTEREFLGLRTGLYKDIHTPKNVETKLLAPLDIPGMTYLGKNHKGLHEYKDERDGSIVIINVEKRFAVGSALGSGGGESGGGGSSGGSGGGGGGEGSGDGDD